MFCLHLVDACLSCSAYACAPSRSADWKVHLNTTKYKMYNKPALTEVLRLYTWASNNWKLVLGHHQSQRPKWGTEGLALPFPKPHDYKLLSFNPQTDAKYQLSVQKTSFCLFLSCFKSPSEDVLNAAQGWQVLERGADHDKVQLWHCWSQPATSWFQCFSVKHFCSLTEHI